MSDTLESRPVVRVSRSPVRRSAFSVLDETELRDSSRSSTLDAKAASCCVDCKLLERTVESSAVNFDNKTSSAALLESTVVETVSNEALSLATVDDKDVASPSADRASEEVASNDAVMSSMREAKWADCIDNELACSCAILASVEAEITAEFRPLTSDDSDPICD